ncbi:DUF4365 domain-containing protein [Mycolicibacter sinensis]|uniref:DUF4365 domain-containing protein n=1 Tax=Mycolicibacter sinensis (strain JDM601) TaxID=875328 RepID=UPI000A7E15BD|nr:DUF4365 domain-containing protein [Mycolicibacter sinensis]
MMEPARKHLRVGHRSERGAINAVRTLLERHDQVVDEVDGRSDYGRDLNVDVTRGSEITGGIIGVQVKGGKSFYRNGRWIIPATPTDWHYWRSSTVPIIGMVHDPATAAIRWINLSQLARSEVQIDDGGYGATPQSDEVTEVVVSNVLDDTTFDAFLGEVSRPTSLQPQNRPICFWSNPTTRLVDVGSSTAGRWDVATRGP